MRTFFHTAVLAVAFALASFCRAAPDDYLIVDLSAGVGGSYPLSYTNQPPAGGWTDEYKTSKLALRKIPRGTFVMGSPTNEAVGVRDASEDQRSVTLTNDFYIGVFELTEGQYQRVWTYFQYPKGSTLPAASHPSAGSSDFLNWFFTALNTGASTNFSLPTEERWEYACRAGTTTAYYFGSDEASLPSYAWYSYNSYNTWQSVGGKPPNAWGLYDMHGNAEEACTTSLDPPNILRGGDVLRDALDCRSASRKNFIDTLGATDGFRVCLTVPLQLYTVTVTNGTADAASGTNGQIVAIWADSPGAAKVFDRWTGDTQTVANVYATNTTLRIQGANVAVTATYRDAPYTLTVYNGSGSGQYASGDLVFISADAPPPGQLFSAWEVVPSGVNLGAGFNASNATTTLTMPGTHLQLTATYAAIPTYTLTVNGGTGGGSYTNGQTVAITASAPPAHHTFLWTGAVSTVAEVTNWTTTLTMPAQDIAVTATYPPVSYPLTVSGGLGSGSYTNGQVVTVTATNWPSAWHAFDFWTGDTGTLASVTAPTTTVTVVGAAALAPSYRPIKVPDNIYMVVDLTAAQPSQAVSYRDDVPEGGWTGAYQTNRLVLRKLPAGSFVMGSPVGETGRQVNETQHNVTLTKVSYLGLFEVTQGQWFQLKGTWPSFANGADRLVRPVEKVSYVDIRGSTNNANWPATAAVDSSSFIGQLRIKTGDTAFDLPTEAQWEYACRAGTTGPYAGTGTLGDMGWYSANSGNATHPVGLKIANAWGLYDMHGNVAERCLDWYAGDYSSTNQIDPKGAVGSASYFRTFRGGACNTTLAEGYCRSAYRGYQHFTNVWNYTGFRVARTAEAAYGLTVVDGLVNTGGLYFAGAQIAISPVRKPGWRTFVRWRVEPAGAPLGSLFDATRADTVVTQPAQAVTVTATYVTRGVLLVR